MDSARISFTARYTGHVWQRLGWSDPRLATPGGRALFQLLRPAMALGRVLGGGRDLQSLLAQRHVLIDDTLRAAIEGEGIPQVLEIAAGLSPRGLRLRASHPQVRVVEADLPAMAAEKRRRLGDAVGPLHQVAELDVTATSGPLSLAAVWQRTLDPLQPVAVVTEGLVNYLPPAAAVALFARLAESLRSSGGLYVTDGVLPPPDASGRTLVRGFQRALEVATRGPVFLHDLPRLLADAGWPQVQVRDPDRDPVAAAFATRRSSLVRVYVARVAVS